MKICIIDSWPNLKFSAEREFLKRICQAGNRIGVSCVPVVTSDEIFKHDPDFVLATHEFTAKLTPYVTFGLMWSPPIFYQNDSNRIKSILSYDGYLVGSTKVREFLNDITSGFPNNRKPSSDFLFLPSCQKWKNITESRREERSLVYAGIHWDGMRHGSLFYNLHKHGLLNAYGPSDSWSHVEDSYLGTIPFDGDSMMHIIAKHGISLCIHKKEHWLANTPSMRLFEAAAVENLIISDDIAFAKEVFGESAFYIDSSLADVDKADFIRGKIEWANTHPRKATEMAVASREIFERNWSLEVLLSKVCDFSSTIRNQHNCIPDSPLTFILPTIDVIIRCGSRPESYVKRAIECVLSQKYVNPRVILTDFSNDQAFREFAASYHEKVKYISSPQTGFRSTSLWDGFRKVDAEYFGVLDDDDTVDQDHWHRLITAIKEDDGLLNRSFSYSGVIRVEEDGAFIDAVNFGGPLGQIIKENRELRFLDFYDPDRLLVLDNYIQSNAWVALGSTLRKINLEDPRLVVAEDMYFYLEMLFLTDFIPVFSQTASWHWRSISADNSMLFVDQDIWQSCIDRIFRRLDNRLFRSTTFGTARLAARQRLEALKCENPATRAPLLFGKDSILPLVNITNASLSECFHDPDEFGIWSSSDFAWFVGYLQEFSAVVELRVRMQAPPHFTGRPQKVQVFANGISLFSDIVAPWNEIDIARVLTFSEPVNSMTLLLICESTFKPFEHGSGADTRSLGIHLSLVSAKSLSNPVKPEQVLTKLDDKNIGLLSTAVLESKPMSWYLLNAVTMAKNGDLVGAQESLAIFEEKIKLKGAALRQTESLLIEKVHLLSKRHD